MRKVALILAECLGALLGTCILALNVPWGDVFLASIPSGGDNPAHPVLMQSIGEAFFNHGSIVHYSYSFWSGFEAFQFYFPFAYLFGAVLAKVMLPALAFKLVTLLPILLLPPAFYSMTRLMGLGRAAGAISSLLAVSFLHTEAHVMWGGNISSTLAGMIGNMWAFVFFAVCFGALLRSRESGHFSLLAAVTFVAASLSHFYAALMLFVLGCVFLLEDGLKFFRGEFSFRSSLPSYLACAISGLCLAWWVIPLAAYTRYSTDFGANWNISLAETFTKHELRFTLLALLTLVVVTSAEASSLIKRLIGLLLFVAGACLSYWAFTVAEMPALGTAMLVLSPIAVFIWARSPDWMTLRVYLFGAIFLALYYANDYLNSTAFLNIRLWPSIYFTAYLVIVLGFSRLQKLIPLPIAGAYACLFYLLVPAPASLEKARTWMQWNYAGIESKVGGKEFLDIVDVLNKEPPARVSFESADINNGVFGTVRAFEQLPALTKHEIVEGGIVNSARFPGAGYKLQCLSSNSCAGWPAGSIMPGTDIPRAIETMRELGVSYHIAIDENTKKGYQDSEAFDVIYKGEHATVYRLKTAARLVETFDREPPVLKQAWPYTTLLNVSRWDALRHSTFAYDTNLAPTPAGNRVGPQQFFNYLIEQWRAKQRVSHDLAWPTTTADEHERPINGYLFSLRSKFVLARELQEGPDFFIADRGFDPDIYVSNLQYGDSELALPLLRKEPGTSSIILHGRGYFADLDGKQIPFEQEVPITFSTRTVGGYTAPFALIRFTNDFRGKYRYVDARTTDPTISPGLPGPAEVEIPRQITENCEPTIQKDFHRLVLTTACPGKPHLIKYSYYPKWRADVPIYLGNNGYMLLTPAKTVTEIVHRDGKVDLVAKCISWFGLLALLLSWWYFKRKTNLN